MCAIASNQNPDMTFGYARTHTKTHTYLSAICHNNLNKGDQLSQEQHTLFLTSIHYFMNLMK